MENFNEGEAVYQLEICHGAKNPPKIVDNYEDCDGQAEYYSEEYLELTKRFSKILRRLDNRSGNNVTYQCQKIKYSYRCKRVKCLNCKDYGHIKDEGSSVPREQRRIYNVSNDNEGEDDQGNTSVSFEVMHTGEKSNLKKRCIIFWPETRMQNVM